MKSDTRVVRDGTSGTRGDTVLVTGSLTEATRTAAQVFTGTWENAPARQGRPASGGPGGRVQGVLTRLGHGGGPPGQQERGGQ